MSEHIPRYTEDGASAILGGHVVVERRRTVAAGRLRLEGATGPGEASPRSE